MQLNHAVFITDEFKRGSRVANMQEIQFFFKKKMTLQYTSTLEKYYTLLSWWLNFVLLLELWFSPVDGSAPVFISSSLELFIV